MKKEDLLAYIVIGLFIGGGLFYFSGYNTKRIIKKQCRQVYKRTFMGVIDSVYNTSQGTFVMSIRSTIMINKLELVETYLDLGSPQKYFCVGDSLFKPANSFKYYIYKQCNPDSLVFLERDITCDDYVNNIYGD